MNTADDGPSDVVPLGLVAECDVADGIPSLLASRDGTVALILIRLFTEPIGMVTETLSDKGMPASDLARTIVAELEPELQERFEECGLDWDGRLPLDGVTPPKVPSFLSSRQRAMDEGPSITAAICTHNRSETLGLAIESLAAQPYERLRILVVDNAPSDQRSERLVAALAEAYDVEYAIEPRIGLSWARNRALELAQSDVVAYVDDDAECDPWWASEIARGFVEVPAADVVTGGVVPMELATRSQLLFEQYGSVRRQRGFKRDVFSPASRHIQSPVYPLPPFGIGANMAFRKVSAERVGGFDTALGPGTPSRLADDIGAMSAVLLAGGTIVYQPSAIVRHLHRRDDGVLYDHLLGHGVGIGAYYTSLLVHHPSCLPELISLVPQAIRDQTSSQGRRLSRLDDSFPPELMRANRIGLLRGPSSYARALVQSRRLRKEFS